MIKIIYRTTDSEQKEIICPNEEAAAKVIENLLNRRDILYISSSDNILLAEACAGKAEEKIDEMERERTEALNELLNINLI